MSFKEFRKRHQGKYYKAYDDYYMYIHIVKIEPISNNHEPFSAFVDSILYDGGIISYVEGGKWVISEEDFDDDGIIYLEVSKRVYDEHMRRYKIEQEWDRQGIDH